MRTRRRESARSSRGIASLGMALGLLVGTASAVDVAYYTDFNTSADGWEQPILDNGFNPIQVLDITTFDFSTVDIMVIDETSNSSISGDLLSRAADLEAYVMGGGKVVIHDRYVTDNSFIPGGGGINLVRDFSSDDDLNVVTAGTQVTEGPFGTITDKTLDGGNSSNHGWALNLPDDTTVILSAGPDPVQAAALSYFLDAGVVYYSTIPLDFYLAGNGPKDLQLAMAGIYAPNVLAYISRISGEPEGACCFEDGSCAELTESECAKAGGTYQGDDTNCKDVDCAPPGDCSGFPCGNGKVLICHVPPGNPGNQRTLCISENAVAAHFNNHPGDHCGPCGDSIGAPK